MIFQYVMFVFHGLDPYHKRDYFMITELGATPPPSIQS